MAFERPKKLFIYFFLLWPFFFLVKQFYVNRNPCRTVADHITPQLAGYTAFTIKGWSEQEPGLSKQSRNVAHDAKTFGSYN